MSKITEKVLLVDDDRNLLASFKRQFHKRVNLITAASGEDGIQAISGDGPFAVAISDMQMPNMNGIQFLANVKKLAPNTVRIMLTGNANLDVAIGAINEGAIFRFLNKPVDPDVLLQAIEDGVRQYRLVTAEKVLLSKTLKGTVDLLSDILSLTNPVAYRQAAAIKRHVKAMIKRLALDDGWAYELAATFSQLGHIAFSPKLSEKADGNGELTEGQEKLFDAHPEIGARLLKHIPRLETVARMIELQTVEPERVRIGEDLSGEEKAVLGGHLMKVATAYQRLLNGGMDEESALAELRGQPQQYDPAFVEALSGDDEEIKSVEVVELAIPLLRPGMLLDQDIRNKAGMLLVPRGHELSEAIIMRLTSAKEEGVIPYDTIKVVQVIQFT